MANECLNLCPKAFKTRNKIHQKPKPSGHGLFIDIYIVSIQREAMVHFCCLLLCNIITVTILKKKNNTKRSSNDILSC